MIVAQSTPPNPAVQRIALRATADRQHSYAALPWLLRGFAD